MKCVDGAQDAKEGLQVGLPDSELRDLNSRHHSLLDAVQPLPDRPDHGDEGAQLGHEGVVIGHHLEKVVGLGAHLARDVHLHLVNIVLEPLLDQSSSRLNLLCILSLKLEWIGSI